MTCVTTRGQEMLEKNTAGGEAGKLCRGAFRGRSLRTAAKPKFENTF